MQKRKFDILNPYYDILLFIVAMLAANFFWKLTIEADEMGLQVLWLGRDITAAFDIVARHIAHVVYALISLTSDTVSLLEPNIIRFATGSSIIIVWSCTAIKQAFIWMIIMLTARGSWLKKLWFIPLGLVCTYLFNFLRITLIAMASEHHPEWFDFLHGFLFKYLFYGMYFGLWLWWIHGLNKKTTELSS